MGISKNTLAQLKVNDVITFTTDRYGYNTDDVITGKISSVDSYYVTVTSKGKIYTNIFSSRIVSISDEVKNRIAHSVAPAKYLLFRNNEYEYVSNKRQTLIYKSGNEVLIVDYDCSRRDYYVLFMLRGTTHLNSHPYDEGDYNEDIEIVKLADGNQRSAHPSDL